ncbi:MAG: LamG-like jellyroll fold domain-containing protein [Pseudomonadota bacterium]
MARNPLSHDPLFAQFGTRDYTGALGDYREVAHKAKYKVDTGTLSMGFSIDKRQGEMALLSKDLGGDTAGDFTVWVKEGRLAVEFETDSGSTYLKVPGAPLDTYTEYHLAVSFGDTGLLLYLNGELVAADADFTTGLTSNTNDFVIGGTRAHTSNAGNDAAYLLDGKVTDLMLFDKKLDETDIGQLAQAIDKDIGTSATMSARMADLAPVFEQLHHGSDTLKEILMSYGVSHQGHMTTPLKMITKGRKNDKVNGSDGADGINGGWGNDTVNGLSGNDVLQGSYGNDTVNGGKGNDIIDGGHGEDVLYGSAGNDLLISRADGREPYVTYDPNRDEGDPDNELTNGKLYPKQPIPADDKLYGGKGADIFYFQTLINAKERFIREHTQKDGSINWHGVAGENDDIHDHWVDEIGHDKIMDYSRAEGDRIIIEGHTTEISHVSYGDQNGDGVVDHSVIHLYSDQGNGGGAHNDDLLGTVTVFGDLVREVDIEQDAGPAYGIVHGIVDLKEALAPLTTSKNLAPIKAKGSELAKAGALDTASSATPVFAVTGQTVFDGADRDALGFETAMDVTPNKGTVAFRFTADEIDGTQVLFSKDAEGYGDGGHTSIYINETGDLQVRIQDESNSHYFDVDYAITAGQSYELAFSFGANGAHLYLNGARMAYDKAIKINWSDNEEAIVVGAGGWSNTSGTLDDINSYFSGTISDVMVFDRQLTAKSVFGAYKGDDVMTFSGRVQDYAFSRNEQNGVLTLTKDGKSAKIGQDITYLSFKDMTVRPGEVFLQSGGQDTVYGRDGSDVIEGRGGADNLHGRGNDDMIRGGNGDDKIYGGDGLDKLFGQGGQDQIYGGDMSDALYGGADQDWLYGEAGNDRFYGGLGDDYIYGHTWHEEGNSKKDYAYFDGRFKDYSFSTESWYHGSRGETVTRLIVTDSADGGFDGYYEGADRLMDIDKLVFDDTTVKFADLI